MKPCLWGKRHWLGPLGDRSGNVSLSSSLDEPDTQISLAGGGGAQYSTLVFVRYSETSNKGHSKKEQTSRQRKYSIQNQL